MPHHDPDQELLELKQQRLFELKKQQAIYGISADPSLIIEIRKLEREIKGLQAQASPPPAATRQVSEAAPASPPLDQTILIENPANIALSPEIDQVLRLMFPGYQRLVIRSEFGGGFGGGRVLLVRPIRPDGVAELPTVIKMASVALIEQEWQAYQQHIQHRWPNIAQIKEAPVFTPGRAWGGLRYRLVGDGTFNVDSLGRYCQYAELEHIQFVLEKRLLKVLDQVLQYFHTEPEFQLQRSYDAILPVNALLEVAAIPAQVTPHHLQPAQVNTTRLKQGDYVRLSHFVVTKVDLNQQTVTLNGPATGQPLRRSASLRLKGVTAPGAFPVGARLDSLECRVSESRAERLEREVRQAMGQNFGLTAEVITMPDGARLPNPLAALPAILHVVRDIRVGGIHGDLNLENILVDPATRDVSLIDFAEARTDHVLHDFLRLETQIVTHLLPEALAQANLGPGLIQSFYQQLDQTVARGLAPTETNFPLPALEKYFSMLVIIRTALRKYLFRADDWTEYYQGLLIYLLAALKFADLNKLGRLPKQVAFWGAAATLALIQAPPSPS
jgi:hypothetical protein